MRVMTLKIYFKDSPNPWTFHEVTNMTCEGALVRITQQNSKNQWYPLVNIFSIFEVDRKEVEMSEK